jgi:hypothetical protein
MKYIFHFRPEPLREDQVFLNLDGAPMKETGLKPMFRRLADSGERCLRYLPRWSPHSSM